jgi:hypothetical protein
MYCPNCGTKVEETDRYCEQCGAPLQTPQMLATKTDPNLNRPTYQENSYSTSYGPYDNGYNGDVKAIAGLKGWLWFIIIANIIGIVYGLVVMFLDFSYGMTQYALIMLVSILLSGVIIFAATRLLVGQKYGFYLFCGCIAMSVIICVYLKSYSSAVGSLLAPVILWLFLRKQWPYFK